MCLQQLIHKVLAECETPTTENLKVLQVEPIKPHEQRALNFLINEYLLMHNYKLTSITFADENEDQVVQESYIGDVYHSSRPKPY